LKLEHAPGGAADREIKRQHRADQRVIGVLGGQDAHVALVRPLVHIMVHQSFSWEKGYTAPSL
jgi:hypothetical protein